MAGQAPPDDLAQKARLVFKGTIQRVRASLMAAEVPPSEQTCIVRIDEVLQAPQSLAQVAGQRVTVLLPEGDSVSRGEQAVFFTNPWLYGETLAVQAVGHHEVSATMAALTRSPGDPSRTLMQSDRQARIAGADLVIRGVVMTVRLIEPTTGEQKAGRRNEHDPMWQEAVTRVTAVERGDNPGPEVIIRFPTSLDVAWRDAPKFRPGDEGRFILRRATSGTGTLFYTALDRYDFQHANELVEEDSQPIEPPR